MDNQEKQLLTVVSRNSISGRRVSTPPICNHVDHQRSCFPTCLIWLLCLLLLPRLFILLPSNPTANVQQLSKPEKFSGDSDNCCAFLVQRERHLEFQAASFTSDQAKVAYIIAHLTVRAEDWATAKWSHLSPVCSKHSPKYLIEQPMGQKLSEPHGAPAGSSLHQ